MRVLTSLLSTAPGRRALTITQIAGMVLLACSSAAAAPAEVGSGAGAAGVPTGLDAAVRADRYKMRGSADSGYHAENAANRIAADFHGKATRIETQGKALNLALTGYGWGGQITDAGAVAGSHVLDATLNRVYTSGLREWFTNDEQGLEHGFVIAKREGTGDLTVRLSAGEGWQVAGSQDRLTFTQGDVILAYSGLRAWDSRGVAAPVRMRTDGHILSIDVADADAVYPLTIDPTFTQQQKLTASNGAAMDSLGYSVAISRDGSTALVGANGASQTGAAYVYTRNGVTWSQQQELIASDGAGGDQFGTAVALSSDGTTALVGAPGKTSSRGAAYAYIRNGATWAQQQEFLAADGAAGDSFGGSVALSGDGSTALVGSPQKAIAAQNLQGAAYVFTRNGNLWSQLQQLLASDGAASDRFGQSAALSADGLTALVGASTKVSGANTNQGAAYIYTRGGTYNQQQKLTASDAAAGDKYGSSVALSSDGSTALIGAPNKTVGANANQGEAYVYSGNGTTWTQQQILISSGAATDNFGISVSLSSTGGTALIGAPGRTTNQGSAYLFGRSGTIWNQLQEVTASDGAASDFFGSAVALSASGGTVLAGAPSKAAGQGAAYVFGNSVQAGVFRNSVSFLLDSNGNGAYDAGVDRFIPNFTGSGGFVTGDVAIAGDWTGDGQSKLGIYRAATGTWFLDANNNGVYDTSDLTYSFGGLAGDMPFVGDWNGLGKSCIGIYRSNGSVWLLDLNCNGAFDNTPTDAFFPFGGLAGDIPIVGAWTGGKTRVGVIRKFAPGGVPQGNPFFWVLDAGAANAGNDPANHPPDIADSFAFGGLTGDVFVAGDWYGTGVSTGGVYRKGFWVLDAAAPGAPQANHLPGRQFAFGGLDSDVPLIGRW